MSQIEKEVLQWYIDKNTDGTLHSQEELIELRKCWKNVNERKTYELREY